MINNILRKSKLGLLDEYADIFAKKGFSENYLRDKFKNFNYTIKIIYRIQDFMSVVSRLPFPIKLLSILDFILPYILKRNSPLVMIIASKR